MKHPISTYRQFSVQGSTPLGLVVMLYDGAIAALQRMITAMEAHNVPEKCNHLNRALAIVAQLEGTLNFEQGGEVARTLKSLYVYARTQAAKLENSPAMLRSLIAKLTSVRTAWYEADHRGAGSPEAPPAADSARPGQAPTHKPSPSRTRAFQDEAYGGDSSPAGAESGSWRIAA